MATRVLFHHVIQDATEFGSNESRAVSRVYFDLEVDGTLHEDLTVDLEEEVGSSHRNEEITVGKVAGIVEREAFERAVRAYYQSLVSSAGYGKNLAKDKGFRTYGDKLSLEQVVEL